MNIRQHTINTAFVLIALGLACAAPLETFLIAYAVLGPLHYLSEISWLHDRQFCLPRRSDRIVLLSATALLLATGGVIVSLDGAVRCHPFIVFAVFFLSSAAVWMTTWKQRAISIAALVAVFFVFGTSLWFAIGALYLMTIIHVYFFTGAFMLSGVLKTNGAAGYCSLGIFALAPAVCLALPVADSSTFSASSVDSFRYSMENVMSATAQLFLGVRREDFGQWFLSPTGIKLARVIAFCYTYHYLNWFAKTSFIGWHRVSAWRLISIIAIWCGSVVLYWYDYTVGFRVLLALGFSHVILEFPLNWISFRNIVMAAVTPKFDQAPANSTIRQP